MRSVGPGGQTVKNKPWTVAAAAVTFSIFSASASAVTVVAPFDTAYQISLVAWPGYAGTNFPGPGVPGPYAAVAFRPGDPNTLLMSGHSYSDVPDNGVYAIGITRDANNHINGFVENATRISSASGLGGGAALGTSMAFQTGRLMFYTSP